MDETRGDARAAITVDGTEFDARDRALLDAIHRTGSVAGAAAELGRSRARSLARIEALETAFGTLVERQRGGSGGGGSRLTDNGRSMLDRYDRLSITLDAAARVPETVLDGVVVVLDGELATVETRIGEIGGLHDGIDVGDRVQLRIGADAITIHGIEATPDPDVTSARNRQSGGVSAIECGETVQTVHVDVGGIDVPVLVTETSASTLELREGRAVAITWKATATRLARRTR
ncbi:MAG: LysR family transcriptional regulator [Natronomonas sp.]|jgi:molybdate transport system regulatory protein|uniref:LysR family transcriptional regulator n=1 Tax=Natronomonas salsuginis TaxID=2217661 RepID=A0A4U5JNF5_9EURY|nr:MULTISPECIES: LysR family transcriptional regulator [Natronomonas]MDR9429165.1 LysR family transcriptional regulator [Natronomonas sp.]TKR27719.1 LysR family transcriptional regulator [Natronomonas salsuginis]